MFDSLFRGVFDGEYANVITPGDFLLCLAIALLAGLILAAASALQGRSTKSYAVTVALLPAIVCVLIMMVNGNVGTGVAVAGAFSLVRYRSAPGTAREIALLFMAMASGLIAGMGYLAYCLLFTVLMSGIAVLYHVLHLGEGKKNTYKTLHITIPENLDYTGVFDDIFKAYTASYTLVRVKTSNMGSLFRLTYDLVLKDSANEKEMIDALRCRNGNLEISVSCQETAVAEL